MILGAKIKYITNEGFFRYGGILINNKYPEYLVLLNPYKKITWCVDLSKNTIFMEDVKKVKKKKILKKHFLIYINKTKITIKNKKKLKIQFPNKFITLKI